jgi:hypothetical protein
MKYNMQPINSLIFLRVHKPEKLFYERNVQFLSNKLECLSLLNTSTLGYFTLKARSWPNFQEHYNVS